MIKNTNLKRVFQAAAWLIMVMPGFCLAASFFNEHQQGWFWYQDPKAFYSLKQKQPSLFSNPTEEMKTLQKGVEENINRAILYPTEENIKNYARTYQALAERSQQFSNAYKVMLLKNPDLDYSLQFPINPIAQTVYQKDKALLMEATVREFAKTHGLFFFFKGRCHYCHVFAPAVKQFCDKYQVKVIPISVDGGVLPEFPNPVKDQYASIQFRVERVPSLFAVNPKTKQVVPVANGALSLDELEENIFKFLQFENRSPR